MSLFDPWCMRDMLTYRENSISSTSVLYNLHYGILKPKITSSNIIIVA